MMSAMSVVPPTRSSIPRSSAGALVLVAVLLGAGGLRSAPRLVTFGAPATPVEAYDLFEVTVTVEAPDVANCFTGAEVAGELRAAGVAPVRVEGFCDSRDGGVFRVRFMPSTPGEHHWSVTYRQAGFERTGHGSITVVAGGRRGPVRVDPAHPYHFVWEGTGEHYFWNATTTYALAGWDDATIRASLERLHALGVNRVRAALIAPRVKSGQQWFEHVYPTDRFTFLFNAWEAARPGSLEDPGFDVTRFNVDHFQKYERLLRFARDRDIVVSVVFYVDGRVPGVDPFGKAGMGGAGEQRYYRYAVARFGAFSNVMWDVANEYRLFRDDAWAEAMGTLVKERDANRHLASVHGHGDFRFRTSAWADFAMYQAWDEDGGYAFMLKNRQEQQATGRPIPQVNEEYGYEDHYPQGWGGNRKAPARNADSRRRLAWEMTMAGGYQTTGERADRGTGWGPDSGGGWVNGRGDDSMTMLTGYARMRDFFTNVAWWTTAPRPDLGGTHTLVLADPGRLYLVYLPSGGRASLTLEAGPYRAEWFDPRTGARAPIDPPGVGAWTSPDAPGAGDWAIAIVRR
jgi:hypothetical protein